MVRLLKWGLMAIGALVVAGALVLVALHLVSPDDSRYDRERWVAQGAAKPTENRRSLMVRAIEQRLRPGMTRAEVVSLLGEPDGGGGAERMTYELGMPGYGVDYEYFIVELGADGRVTRWRREQG